MVGAYAMYGRNKKYMQGFVGKPEGKQPLKRPRHLKSLNQNFLFFLELL